MKFPFTATAFGTALEMLSGSALLALGADAAVPLVGLLNAKDEDAMHAEVARTPRSRLPDDQGEGRLSRWQRTSSSWRPRRKWCADAPHCVSMRTRRTRPTRASASSRRSIPQGIELFEQPCAAGDWDAHLAVARVAEVPMMLDESIYGLADIEKAARLEAATYLKLKLMKLVTLAALSKAIDRIRELGMKPVLGNGVACDPGCWMEGCIAARQIDNAGEMNGFLKARSPLIENGLAFRNGAMTLKAGYAPRLDRAALDTYAIESFSFGRARPAPT